LSQEQAIQQSELKGTTTLLIKAMTVNNGPVIFFAGSTKNNRIVLYAYDRLNGEQIAKTYFGHTHIYEVSALSVTDDDGLALLGSTFAAGQLGRICLFKLSKTDLEILCQ